jgi:hypothetical protein
LAQNVRKEEHNLGDNSKIRRELKEDTWKEKEEEYRDHGRGNEGEIEGGQVSRISVVIVKICESAGRCIQRRICAIGGHIIFDRDLNLARNRMIERFLKTSWGVLSFIFAVLGLPASPFPFRALFLTIFYLF